MSFEFFSAGNVVLDVAPFGTINKEGETAQAAYARKKSRVMEWLVGLSNRETLAGRYHPTKDAFPDMVDMAIIKTTDPERWERLELDAMSDLALNGFEAPAPELTLVASPETASVDAALTIPVPRPSEEELARAEQPAA